MRFVVLGSGSRGNALAIESGGRRILVDAGFSCREMGRRLESLGSRLEDFEALLLTHEHSDHRRGADVMVRRYGLPVFATEGTLRGAALRPEAAALSEPLRSGEPFEVAGFRVEAFSLPHDAADPVGFVIEDSEGHRLGLAADLGCRTQLAWARLRDLDALILETNHDLHMLRTGPYPWALKQRVAGRYGHLSNAEAAEGLVDLLCDDLRTVVLYHLSQTNNLPALAAEAIGEKLDKEGCDAQVVVTQQQSPSDWIELGAWMSASRRTEDLR